MHTRYFLIFCLSLLIFPSVRAVEHPDSSRHHFTDDPVTINVRSRQFSDMSEAISHYQQLLEQGEWPQLADGPLLRLGDRHHQLSILRTQLQQLGDLETDQQIVITEPEYFDELLHQALQNFQQRHGVKVDGILGPVSRGLLNIYPEQRLDQLLVNLNRQQQFIMEADSYYLQVNIPEFRLRVVQDGNVLIEMKTIVGRKKRKTPIFNTEIQALVLNPSWSVPKSIAHKDIIPVWREDPDYAARLRLQVVSGKGRNKVFLSANGVDPEVMYKGPDYPHFWEPPGLKNTLGRIKFMSRSRYAIYLHDTSAKSLFDQHKRAFSSGCIRVEKAQQLADLLLQIDNSAQRDLLAEKLETIETGEIYLKQAVPVYMTYWTAWIDHHGLLNFRDDLYRRDKQALTLLRESEIETQIASD